MLSEHFNKTANGFETALQSCGGPTLEKPLRCPRGSVFPEMLKLIFQYPSPVDSTIAFSKGVEDVRVSLGAIGGVLEEQPTKSFEGFSLICAGLPPLFFADLVNGLVEGLDDVKSIQDEGGLGAVLLDCSDVRLAHIAAGPLDLLLLVAAEGFGEEPINALPALAFADPDHAGSVHVIDNGGVLMAFAVGNLIDANALEAPNSVSVPESLDGAVEQIRQGRFGNAKDLGPRFLAHHLAIQKHDKLETVAHPGMGIRPRDHLLNPTVGRATDFLGTVHEEDAPPAYRNIAPFSGMLCDPDNPAATLAHRTQTAVLVRLDPKVQRALCELELKIDDPQPFQMQQF